eukprot:GHVU01087067.1.p2 GENE.GHVU01087067.1~~GHVU01087067.1.p2  ORF type:complete len:104 (-),score=3.25 GHVU01087067.1:382-693(-)
MIGRQVHRRAHPLARPPDACTAYMRTHTHRSINHRDLDHPSAQRRVSSRGMCDRSIVIIIVIVIVVVTNINHRHCRPYDGRNNNPLLLSPSSSSSSLVEPRPT